MLPRWIARTSGRRRETGGPPQASRPAHDEASRGRPREAPSRHRVVGDAAVAARQTPAVSRVTEARSEKAAPSGPKRRLRGGIARTWKSRRPALHIPIHWARPKATSTAPAVWRAGATITPRHITRRHGPRGSHLAPSTTSTRAGAETRRAVDTGTAAR